MLAVANGAGKSTFTRSSREAFQDSPVLDPDAVAKAAARTTTGGSAIDAGRRILGMCEEFLERRESFLVETTLSGKTYLRMMKRAASLGYTVRLIYVGTESVETNMQRIRDRVLNGGHDVPEEDQRRRFPRSFVNLRLALQLASEVALLDNSSERGHRLVAVRDSEGSTSFPPVPECVRKLNL